MGKSKVIYNDETIIDLSNDTVNPGVLKQGYTAHNSNGDPIVGTMVPESGGGSGGSGIIDVTELPTSGIDENAVYRVTETVPWGKKEVYLRTNDSVTAREFLTSLGSPTIPKIYVVDELSSSLKISDVQYYSEINLYILRSDGICYLNAPALGGFVTLGLLGFQAVGYDKGATDNVYAETDIGVYTTLGEKTVVRYFIRESGEWIELGLPSTAEIIDTVNPTQILSQEYFRKKDGNVITTIKSASFYDDRHIREAYIPEGITTIEQRAFYNVWNMSYAEIPSSISEVGTLAFYDCTDLRTVVFKGTPDSLDNECFGLCSKLTAIFVPWSESDPINANAPWGARNATIVYNYTEG